MSLSYSIPMLRHPSVVRPSVRPSVVRPSSVRRSHFQRSSPLKLHSQSKPNFMWSILSRVLTHQGKVREKQNFAKVREMSGNFDECQGNLKNKANVREMSGNFEIMSGNFALGLF